MGSPVGENHSQMKIAGSHSLLNLIVPKFEHLQVDIGVLAQELSGDCGKVERVESLEHSYANAPATQTQVFLDGLSQSFHGCGRSARMLDDNRAGIGDSQAMG